MFELKNWDFDVHAKDDCLVALRSLHIPDLQREDLSLIARMLSVCYFEKYMDVSESQSIAASDRYAQLAVVYGEISIGRSVGTFFLSKPNPPAAESC